MTNLQEFYGSICKSTQDYVKKRKGIKIVRCGVYADTKGRKRHYGIKQEDDEAFCWIPVAYVVSVDM